MATNSEGMAPIGPHEAPGDAPATFPAPSTPAPSTEAPSSLASSAAAPRVLACCGDLFFGGQLLSMLRAAGCEPVQEFGAGRLAERIAAIDRTGWTGVVVDLETPGLDLPAVVAAANARGNFRVIAFGPHVHAAKLDAARAAGCDAVLSRGAISSQPELLRRLLGGMSQQSPP